MSINIAAIGALWIPISVCLQTLVPIIIVTEVSIVNILIMTLPCVFYTHIETLKGHNADIVPPLKKSKIQYIFITKE